MSDPSLTSKIDTAITRQTAYIKEINESIAGTDDRLIDKRAALRHELQAAELVLANLKRERQRNTPLGGGSPTWFHSPY